MAISHQNAPKHTILTHKFKIFPQRGGVHPSQWRIQAWADRAAAPPPWPITVVLVDLVLSTPNDSHHNHMYSHR